jgi:uncharacterized protein YjiS (DUF1127 family)
MSAIVAKDSMDFVMLASLSTAGIIPGRSDIARRGEPARPSLVERVAGAVQWLVELPRRNAVVEELSVLSDRELADIGLSRADVGRVFDAKFNAERDCLRG